MSTERISLPARIAILSAQGAVAKCMAELLPVVAMLDMELQRARSELRTAQRQRDYAGNARVPDADECALWERTCKDLEKMQDRVADMVKRLNAGSDWYDALPTRKD